MTLAKGTSLWDQRHGNIIWRLLSAWRRCTRKLHVVREGAISESSPRIRLSEGHGGRVRYERVSEHIQLSRPSKIVCCMAFSDMMHVQMVTAAVGVSLWRNWMLKRTGFVVWGGGAFQSLPMPVVVRYARTRRQRRRCQSWLAPSLWKVGELPVSGRAIQQYWFEAVVLP